MKLTIIGSGNWATALAHAFSKNIDEIYLLSRSESTFDNARHINLKYFPDVILNSNIRFTTSYKEAIDDADIILFCVPSSVYAQTAKNVGKYINNDVSIISASKGLEGSSFGLLSDVLRKNLPSKKIKGVVSLIGPSFANEVILDKVTAVTASSRDIEVAKEIQKLLSTPTFRIYTNDDEIGCQICSALKNVIAIASGAIAGLNQGENAKAALVTRGLVEMIRFGSHFNAKKETFYGLTGIGDLLLTCSSKNSRNFYLGYQIGLLDDADTVLSKNEMTCEGVITSKYAYDIAKSNDISMPIIESVYQVLYEHIKPSKCISSMMQRSLKAE